MGQTTRAAVPTARSPSEINPDIQAALANVPEFAALDAETQLTVVGDVAAAIRDGAASEAREASAN